METTENTKDTELYSHSLGEKVIGCAIEGHRNLGPGLLESAYRKCLEKELFLAGIQFQSEHPVSVSSKGTDIDCGYRIDLYIEDFLVVELKAVEHISRIHQAQILTYVKLAEAPIGLILNFNVGLLKHGIKKLVL